GAWLSGDGWALAQACRSPGVAGCRLMLACVGSWKGSLGGGGWSPPFPPPAGETAKTVNNARRAADLHWNGPFGPTRWRRAYGVDLGMFARPAWTGPGV